MDKITTSAAFETVVSRAAWQRMLVMLVSHGVPKEAAAELCIGMADLVRSLHVTPDLDRLADITALHFEDMANMMFGGGLLPREPD